MGRFDASDSEEDRPKGDSTTAAGAIGREDDGSGLGPQDSSPALPLQPTSGRRVKGARFIKSSVTLAQCPPPTLPEVAAIGRSNVGKSSLVNSLTGRRQLAAVSKTPGKTRAINHFSIDDAWYLVDLPGYGYAKTSKARTLDWSAFTRDYIARRESLARVLLLVDASIPALEIDLAAARWFQDSEIPWALVFTKFDKKKKGCPRPADNADAFVQTLRDRGVAEPESFRTSSREGSGRVELLAAIRAWCADMDEAARVAPTSRAP